MAGLTLGISIRARTVKMRVGAVTKMNVRVEQNEKGLSKTLQVAIIVLLMHLVMLLHVLSQDLHPLQRAWQQ